MRANTTGRRIERARRRHVPACEGPHKENERDVSGEHALYLLERDFYGFSLEGDIRARSFRHERTTSSK